MSLHGVLLIHKPEGPTSHDVVHQVRRRLKIKQVGHAGTLDPLASGLLVLLLGEGTKLSNFLLEGDKSYQTTFLLGVKTDTLDITGTVLDESDSLFEPQKILDVLMSLQGRVELPVPHFSAVKVKGEKLYEKARRGESFEPPRKVMDFKSFSSIEIVDREVRFHMVCAKGGFVRALAAELGERLGCGAVMKDLQRTSSAPFELEDALSLEKLEILTEGSDQAEVEGNLGKSYIPLAQALPHWPGVKVAGREEKLLLNGQIAHSLEQMLIHHYLPNLRAPFQGVRVMSRNSGALRALLSPKEGYGFKIQRIFPPH